MWYFFTFFYILSKNTFPVLLNDSVFPSQISWYPKVFYFYFGKYRKINWKSIFLGIKHSGCFFYTNNFLNQFSLNNVLFQSMLSYLYENITVYLSHSSKIKKIKVKKHSWSNVTVQYKIREFKKTLYGLEVQYFSNLNLVIGNAHLLVK